jgi:tight adherence protein B
MIQPILISLFAALAVAILFYGLFSLRQEGDRKGVMMGRLQGETLASVDARAAAGHGTSVVREHKFSHIPYLNDLMAGAAISGLIRLWLLQARVKTPPGTILLGSLLLAAIGFFGIWWTLSQLTTAIAIALVLGSLPLIAVERKRRKRFAAFTRQLPDALTMMKNSLQAGHTLDKAMQVISHEMPDPVALEFRETVEELHLGVPVKRAMENFSNRIIDENVNIFVAALLVQREIGGNLTELLGNLSHTIRERFRIEQEVHTLTAEGRISGYVVGALPIVLAVIINMLQPEYLAPLYQTETGLMLLKGAVVLNIIGFWAIRKVCSVNF